MKVFTSVEQWRTFRSALNTGSVGFVPTMGALHPGHLSLLDASLQNNELSVVSLFVNPGQFNDRDDLETYPKDPLDDLALLEENGADVVFMPDAAQIYADDYRFRVTEGEFSRQLCGASRPGHFDGVLTVVMRLLNLVLPRNAYFGEKDYQQLQLIRGMTEAFFMDINIVACPTVREPDGLAMSSRNRRLDAGQRQRAAYLYATLKQCRSALQAEQTLTKQGFDVDYVRDVGRRRFAAARLGNTRLIDNVEI